MKKTASRPSIQPWCSDADGKPYSYNEFLEQITLFHGYPAPGLVIGGKMVEMARQSIPDGCLFDAVVETCNCLADAVQMLTPCTAGNGWLKMMDLGRFALALYDKKTGTGTRVFLHPQKMGAWPIIDSWFFKRKPKAEQDSTMLLDEIRQAGDRILGVQTIRMRPEILTKESVGTRALCPGCGESYPLRHGDRCRACQGQSPYIEG